MSLSFTELEQELSDVPMTWIPVLLRALVRRAEAANVFTENGLVLFVRTELEKLRK